MIFKKSTFLLASLIGIILFADVVQAQNQRIAFIDSEYILSRIPEYDGVEQRLQQLSQTWRDEITDMEREINQLQTDFEAREILFTPEIRQERQREIDNKIRERERYIDSRFGPNGDFFRQQRELLEPIQRRVVEAVEKVATRDGLDFVIDRSGDYVFFYARRQWNVSNEVLLELGIQVDEDLR